MCENPTVVAAAANRLGAASQPLVCIGGYPAAAATLLLRTLASAGARLRYHGDFDWDGMTIANTVIDRYAAAPWRLDAASYRTASEIGGRPLRGQPVDTPWDPALANAMQMKRGVVEEELVIEDLLADLR